MKKTPTKPDMVLFIMLLMSTSIFGKVHTQSIVDVMIESNNQGTSGPGFFISNEQYTNTSKVMRQQLGIRTFDTGTPSNYTPEIVKKKLQRKQESIAFVDSIYKKRKSQKKDFFKTAYTRLPKPQPSTNTY